MQQVKGLLEALQEKVAKQQKEEREAAQKRGEEWQKALVGMVEFAKVAQDVQKKLLIGFSQFAQDIELEKLIPVIREGVRRFEESEYPRIITQVCAVADAATKSAAQALVQAGSQANRPPQDHPSSSETPPLGTSGETPPAPLHDTAKVEIISIKTTKVPFDKPLLSDEADVESYLKAMRETLLEEIRQGKRIQI